MIVELLIVWFNLASYVWCI